jgi:outer membrane protein
MTRTLRNVFFLALLLLLSTPAVRAQAQGPLTLSDAVRQALQQNPELRSSEDQARAAHARVNQARASWLPRLDAGQGFTRGNNPVYVFGSLLTQRQFTGADFALPLLNAPTPLDNFQSRISGQMMLFDSGQTHLRVQAAHRMESAADYQTAQQRQDLVLHVVRAYYDWVVAIGEQQAAAEALRSAKANAERVRTMEKAGMVVSADRLSAEVFQARMQDRVIRAENAVELARLALVRQMNVAPASIGQPARTMPSPEPIPAPIDEWVRRALANRPLLQAAGMQSRAADSGSKLAKAQFGPTIGLFANVERDAETLGGPSGTNWTAGAQLNWNIFAGGADRARLAEAEARKSEAKHQLEWLRSGIELEVRQAYLNTRAAAERVTASHDASQQSEESLRIIQNRYTAGLVTITELLRAQSARLDARTGYLSALHDWQVARAELERAAGQLTPDSPVVLARSKP